MATSGIHDRRPGRYGATGKNGALGSTRAMYNNGYETEDLEPIPDQVDDVDDYVEALIAKKAHSDGNTAIKMEPQRSDMNSLTTGYRNEGAHTTTARSTISPFSNRILYPSGLGPSGTEKGVGTVNTVGNHIHIGSERGWVSPAQSLPGIDDDDDEYSGLFDIRDLIDDPMARSFKKYQKSLNNTLYEINECLRDN